VNEFDVRRDGWKGYNMHAGELQDDRQCRHYNTIDSTSQCFFRNMLYYLRVSGKTLNWQYKIFSLKKKKSCSFVLSIISVFINVSWAPNQHVIIDHVTLKTGVMKIQLCHRRLKLDFKIYYNQEVILNGNNILQHWCFYCVSY